MGRRLPQTGRSPWLGTALGVAAVVGSVAALAPIRAHVTRATPALVLVLAVVAAGLLGGGPAATATAVTAALAFNLALIPPYWTLKVTNGDDWVALGVFLVVAVTVGLLVAAEADRRRAAEGREAEMRELYDHVESMAAERARLLEEAARVQVLERTDEHRSALLRSVSHDLRTPLATIRTVATDLRDGVVYDDATRKDLLSAVCDEAERLDRIVANLLSLSRIEAGALQPERQAVAFDELVGERIRRMRAMFLRVRVQSDVSSELPLVDGDYSQLDQVLTNLLENAARHAPPGSTVRVAALPRQDHLEVRVSDEGHGVADWERAKIFEPFQRGERAGSSGVGLAICKAIVDAHDGSIWVDRTPGGGATFVFTLPLRTVKTR